MLKKIYVNGLLKDAIMSKTVRTTLRFSHGHPTNGASDANSTTNNSTTSSNNTDDKIPDPPTNCCMSGCANCVWIGYAEELSSKLRDGSEVARDIIMKEVQDTNMRSFLEMELRMLKSREKK